MKKQCAFIRKNDAPALNDPEENSGKCRLPMCRLAAPWLVLRRIGENELRGKRA
ncbi:hypothetical protein [Burkholderia anthina]|uniref:hypothetical protein n=1 Tax=Burkholderia anthina TaxID=179879 RepID=UPI001589A576|nr:hypothetical protein [Burkholderia anthina]